MKKGFTLIELLAVIVILAIIAVIAVPIVLNIIEESKENSNKRSIDLYGKALELSIAREQMNGNVAVGNYTTTDGKTLTQGTSTIEVDYSGNNVVCNEIIVQEDTTVYLNECTVSGQTVEYTYGEKQINQVYKPQYYWFNLTSGNIGDDLPDDAKANVSETNTQGLPFYLGFDVDANNKITEGYVCFTRNETEYCLKGYDTESYKTNKTVLEDAYKDVANACSVEYDGFSCSADGLYAHAYSDGGVIASGGSVDCYVLDSGDFGCNEC